MKSRPAVFNKLTSLTGGAHSERLPISKSTTTFKE